MSKTSTPTATSRADRGLVLGIDPGLGTTGWGLVEADGKGGFAARGCGAILTPIGRPLPERLQVLAAELRALVRRAKPDCAAVEELFIAKNSSTAASVGHGRGVLLLVLAELGLAIHEYNPRRVKVALTGYGAADKAQMQTMTQRLLRLNSLPKPDDAADALAIALCHLNAASVEAPKIPKVSRGPKGYSEAWVKSVLAARR